MTIFLDMDGVIADFVGATCQLFNKPRHTVDSWNYFENWNLTEDQFWAKIDSAGYDFWSGLPKTPEADLIVECLEDYAVYILSAPPKDPHSYSGKRMWLEKHYPQFASRLILTKHKHLVADRDRLLIDDSDTNILNWEQNGGLAYLWPQPWNKDASWSDRSPVDLVTDLELFLSMHYG